MSGGARAKRAANKVLRLRCFSPRFAQLAQRRHCFFAASGAVFPLATNTNVAARAKTVLLLHRIWRYQSVAARSRRSHEEPDSGGGRIVELLLDRDELDLAVEGEAEDGQAREEPLAHLVAFNGPGAGGADASLPRKANGEDQAQVADADDREEGREGEGLHGPQQRERVDYHDAAPQQGQGCANPGDDLQLRDADGEVPHACAEGVPV